MSELKVVNRWKRRHNVVECCTKSWISSKEKPLFHRSICSYSAHIPNIIFIPGCRNKSPLLHFLSFPRAGERALLAPSQITQSISSRGRGRVAKRRDGGGTGTSAERSRGKTGTEAGSGSAVLDGWILFLVRKKKKPT